MARRKNALSPEDLTPAQAPIYVVDSFESATDLFLRDARIRNVSDATMRFYRVQLEIFREKLEKARFETAPAKITENAIKSHVILAMMDAGQKETSINCVLRAARALFNFLVRDGYLRESPMRKMTLVRQKKTVIATFSSVQVRVLLDQPDQKTFVGVRDRTLMMLLFETGVRIRELVEIELSHINWQHGVILIDGKGNKERFVPFQGVMRRQLAKYVQLRGELDTKALFVTIDNTPVSIRSVQDQITMYGRRAGITDVRCSPHTFRHTFAKMSVKNGADVFALQAVLGHATLDQVKTYVNLFSSEVSDQHRKFSPIEKLF